RPTGPPGPGQARAPRPRLPAERPGPPPRIRAGACRAPGRLRRRPTLVRRRRPEVVGAQSRTWIPARKSRGAAGLRKGPSGTSAKRRRIAGPIPARFVQGAEPMDLRLVTDWLDRQRWLESTANIVQPAVKGFFDGLGPARRTVKNFLHGTWLDHPLHPVMTDLPLGAWTATLLLDAMDAGRGRSGLARAADASLALGLLGAAGSAATGLTDWSETDA